MLNTEIWKKINDLPYYINECGEVMRDPNAKYKHKNKVYVRTYINNKGYVCINLYKNSKPHRFTIHRLLATYFIPNPDDLPEVNHIDGNPQNNSLSNLEWCTHKQNIQHAWDTNLFTNKHACASVKRKNSSSQYRGVSWSNGRQRWCVYLTFNKKRHGIGRFKSELDAAKAYDTFIIENDLQQYGYKPNFS